MEKIKDVIQPLDMIFFHGGDIASKTIHLLEKITVGSAEYTHVGIVVNDELLPGHDLEKNIWYIWESTFSSAHFGGDIGVIGTKGGYFGTQLRKLHEVIPAYLANHGTKVAWCELKNNPWKKQKNRNGIIKTFSELFNRYNHIRYDYNPISLLGSMIHPLRTHNDKLFCSELVTLVYVKLGILPNEVDPSSVIPMDFFGIDADKTVPCCVKRSLVL